ncbi:fibronectin type III domain-containing protein [Winogradskyella thalassocola]|uniref:Receptor L domain-containing protein n=1 Tax=Winogradskyella thalassocola TaxID=262004 RepID=A0A1G8KA85_9FLAO|nr:hypothetical protein [Winogradskyella thalassocola]SDI40303.1 Receptor L domain-containing protein [Winogradskyella thalassocola]
MEIAVIKKHLFLGFILLFLSTCSDNDVNETENQPPSAFEVSLNDLTNTSAEITWTASIDPEGSTVFYDVYLNNVKQADNITEMTYHFENLPENENFTGEIIASDPEGNTVSAPFNFETALNQPPSLFEITVTSTNPFYSSIEWTESIDPEDRPITYNIYLDNALIEEETTTLNQTFESLKGLTDYSGSVEAVDEQGKTTTVLFSFTTDLKVYDDDLLLSNQSMVENFGNDGYNEINGNLNIGSIGENLTDVSDLSLLETIYSVKGNLSIRHTICTNFSGLQNIDLEYDYAKLTIEDNDQLLNCEGLNSITAANQVYISDNDNLLNLNGLSSLSSVTNYFWVVYNPNLNSLEALENLTFVPQTLSITNNDSLTTLLGLEGVTATGELRIIDNNNLLNLEGLNNLSSSNSSVIITDNNTLQNLNGLSSLQEAISLHVTGNPLITSLNGLENLTDLNHTLEISDNTGLTTLNGIENITFSDNQANYHALIISGNTNITNLDPLQNFTFNRGLINIHFNSLLSDLCGLTTLISEIDDFMNGYNFATNNAYNPSEMHMLNGECSN